MEPLNALNVVAAVCSAHLCNAADREIINQALAALHDAIQPKHEPTPEPVVEASENGKEPVAVS